MIVVWPTATPATSVIALSGPGARTPTFKPNSEARGRLFDPGFWAETNIETSRNHVARMNLQAICAPDGLQTQHSRSVKGF
jgi:hypothetical protein